MQIILLSGGSGKRLWPLSNNTRSKQFIIKIVLNVENIRNVFAGKMIKYHYPYVSKYIYRTQDLAKVASFSDSKPQKQHYAKINGLEKLIINTGNEPFH